MEQIFNNLRSGIFSTFIVKQPCDYFIISKKSKVVEIYAYCIKWTKVMVEDIQVNMLFPFYFKVRSGYCSGGKGWWNALVMHEQKIICSGVTEFEFKTFGGNSGKKCLLFSKKFLASSILVQSDGFTEPGSFQLKCRQVSADNNVRAYLHSNLEDRFLTEVNSLTFSDGIWKYCNHR